jgi:hypothetical protein
MKFKDKYTIVPCEFKIAKYYIERYHYLHVLPKCKLSFCLVENTTSDIKGVVCYSTPTSMSLRTSLFGAEEKNNINELTRLWIKEGTEKNLASYLVGNTLKLQDKEIIVSFADTGQGHLGVIYQATNFMYVGLSPAYKQLTIKGKHHYSLYGIRKQEAIERFGIENLEYRASTAKHRYVYLNSSSKRRKELLSKLKLRILDYPL